MTSVGSGTEPCGTPTFNIYWSLVVSLQFEGEILHIVHTEIN